MEPNFKKIVNALHAASYTDAQLAKLCDCTRQQIFNIRKGKTTNVSYKIGRRLEKLYEALP